MALKIILEYSKYFFFHLKMKKRKHKSSQAIAHALFEVFDVDGELGCSTTTEKCVLIFFFRKLIFEI